MKTKTLTTKTLGGPSLCAALRIKQQEADDYAEETLRRCKGEPKALTPHVNYFCGDGAVLEVSS